MFTLIFCLTIAVLIIASWSDLSKHIIPNWLTIPGCIIALAIHLIWHNTFLWFYLLGLLPALSMLFLNKMNKQFGSGDIKLALFIGLAVGGFAPLLIFGISLVVTVLFNIYKAFKPSKNRGIPMAPFFLAGTMLVYLLNVTVYTCIY
ncbi:MAG: prepilin peptidase [Bacilli bacterium]|nr:prepilin peptidase [Bacilli bacterium]